jgi:hypothetical protein
VSRLGSMVLTSVCASAVAATPSTAELRVRNLVPKFEIFYKDALNSRANESRRWRLWVKEYGFAAVPPTPEGREVARKQLETAWPKYAAFVPIMNERESQAEQAARKILPKVEALLDPKGKPPPIKLLLFVGQFDGNEFTAPPQKPGGAPTVVMPIETDNIRFAIAQEFMHAVQINVDNLRNGFDAPLGETVLSVGLAMRGTEHLFPGNRASLYTWRTAGWLTQCLSNSQNVLRGIRPYLFAYNLARVPEADMANFVDREIVAILARANYPKDR